MIVIPKDLSGNYPESVTELLEQLKISYLEEDDLDDFYNDSSMIVGCDCGCGGDSYFDSYSELMDDRREILTSLEELGYVVEVEDRDADYDTDVEDVEGC